MTPHMKCATYLVILCITNVWCFWDGVDNDVSEDSGDDSKLKQALILVDLLKNVYMRTLRENRELRKMGNIETKTTTERKSTGASTNEPNPVSSPTLVTKRLSSHTTTATSKLTKVKPTSTKKVSPFRTLLQSAPNRFYRRMGMGSAKTAKPPSSQQLSDQKTRLKSIAAELQSQVASELFSEMNKEISKNYLSLIKPTLKVHLGGSTRLPIPLPENHAFCYTNPRNPLCRTAI